MACDPAQQLDPAGALIWNVKKRAHERPDSDRRPGKKLRLTIHHSVEVADLYCDDSDDDACEKSHDETGVDEHGGSCDDHCADAKDARKDSCAVVSDSSSDDESDDDLSS